MTSSEYRGPRVAARLRCNGDADPITIEISNDSISSHGYRLVHSAEAIDLSQAGRGIPLLVSHNADSLPIGRAMDLRIEGSSLVGVLKFGSGGASVEQDMRAGILTDVSVGADYHVDDAEIVNDIITINRWRPLEVSAVSIGAISGASVRNNLKVIDMEHDERLTEIRGVFAAFDGPEYDKLRLRAIDEGWSAEKARSKLLNHFAARDKRDVEDIPSTAPRIEPGDDQRDKFQAAAEIAVRFRAGAYMSSDEGRAQRKADELDMRTNEVAGYTLLELARESLHRAGVRTAGLSASRVADLAIRGNPQTWRYTAAAGHTSSDFTSLISTTANKQLAAGYDEADESWRVWTSTVSLSNFQSTPFPNLSSFSDLVQRREGGAYEFGTFSDRHETMTLAEYGRQFSLDRQTIINDDLNAFTRVPMYMGRAAARNVGDLVYAVLTTGTTATMTEDGVALFASGHSNYVTAGAAPSVATVTAGFVAMAIQTDPGGATLGLRPRYMIVPTALEMSSRVLIRSANDPAITPETPNPIQGLLELVSDYRLQSANSAGWYLAASPGAQVETVAVGFLDGQQSPSLSEETTNERPGVIYTVSHDVTAAALDYRGLYYNDGVT